MTASDPPGLLLWGGQALQSPASSCPVSPLYVSAAQSVHAAEPVAALYLPVAQAVGVPPSGPVYPALAVQSDTASDATGLLLLDGQASQAALDVVDDLNVPDKHGDTLLPLPVYPASARQALTAAECAGLCECAGQAAHALPSPW